MDVSKENDAYNISEDRLPSNATIAASSWLLSSTKGHFDARLSVLRKLSNIILTRMPEFKLWCLVGDSAWQDDNRIIRHKKLFKRLKARGVEANQSADFLEFMKEEQGRLKFFGATQLSELPIESVIKMLAEEPCSYLVAIDESSDIEPAVRQGWEAGDFFDKNLLNYTIENNALLFKVVGKFDDSESGFVGLGKPSLLKKLT